MLEISPRKLRSSLRLPASLALLLEMAASSGWSTSAVSPSSSSSAA
jgi:hypothetical protein